MTNLSAARYQERAVDAQAIQTLGLPPDALAEGCCLTDRKSTRLNSSHRL